MSETMLFVFQTIAISVLVMIVAIAISVGIASIVLWYNDR